MSTAQLVTYGDASFANMEGSKSQCGVIVFLTHEPRRFWRGEFQLGHLVYWTSSTIKRVVRSTLATETYSVSEAVEETQWLRSVLAEMWPSVPSSSLKILEDSGDGFLAQTDCDTLRFLQSLPTCQIRQGDWLGQAAPDRDGNAETSLLWSTGSDTCVYHNSHDARRCSNESPGPLSFAACGRDFRATFSMSDSMATTFSVTKTAIGFSAVALFTAMLRAKNTSTSDSLDCAMACECTVHSETTLPKDIRKWSDDHDASVQRTRAQQI